MTDFSKHEDVPPRDTAPPVPPQGQAQGPHAVPSPPPPYQPPAPPPPPYGHGYAHGPLPYPPPPVRPPTTPAMWAHLGALLTLVAGSSVCCIGWALAWVAPLVIRSNQHNKHDPFIRHHAAQAINYGITTAIVGLLAVAGYVGGLVGLAAYDDGSPGWLPVAAFGLLAVAGLHLLAGLILCIIGSTKANGGQWWSYPKFFALPFVRG
ncbi:DUF4870 domain-containing protein [Actinacidiphila glaucinigra]|uniref:DUF4870 domain-containing protein n=1 Tax=Actinacidiphila glaucinigra TaxID=235986 RepID=UPI002DD8BE57|nr:DUF4870 domain-containing protein [Actinacidiphila glaucinigra]WSD60731.1 DUF4870 domain-containing protein [Actinacidiphila glaucinigra]